MAVLKSLQSSAQPAMVVFRGQSTDELLEVAAPAGRNTRRPSVQITFKTQGLNLNPMKYAEYGSIKGGHCCQSRLCWLEKIGAAARPERRMLLTNPGITRDSTLTFRLLLISSKSGALLLIPDFGSHHDFS